MPLQESIRRKPQKTRVRHQWIYSCHQPVRQRFWRGKFMENKSWNGKVNHFDDNSECLGKLLILSHSFHSCFLSIHVHVIQKIIIILLQEIPKELFACLNLIKNASAMYITKTLPCQNCLVLILVMKQYTYFIMTRNKELIRETFY